MNKALNELKIQAKILLKSAKNNQASAIQRLTKHSRSKLHSNSLDIAYADLAKLKHCQHVLAREVGFDNWQHAHAILGATDNHQNGTVADSETVNMGKLWHSHKCDAFINLWFSTYQEARIALQLEPSRYLIPYQQQFIVVTEDYIAAIGLHGLDSSLWRAVNHDLVASFATETWDEIAFTRLRYRTA